MLDHASIISQRVQLHQVMGEKPVDEGHGGIRPAFFCCPLVLSVLTFSALSFPRFSSLQRHWIGTFLYIPKFWVETKFWREAILRDN